MGWGDCGHDSEKRPIGYVFRAVCDKKDCDMEIDRGLAYACGGMHGEDYPNCEKYFCTNHLFYVKFEGRVIQLCTDCAKILEKGD